MIKKIVSLLFKIGKAKWIVELDGQGTAISPGFIIFGIRVFYYKWNDIFLIDDTLEYRIAQKRELFLNGHG
jgi:hypothetical protein